jgi:DNA mismatch repair ATPase MutS
MFGDVNPGCFVAVVEGRGSARGEVGVATISMSNPTLILCQFSDTRTYVRTLTKIAVFNPAEIIVPTAVSCFGSAADPSMNKLYDDMEDHFPCANVSQVNVVLFRSFSKNWHRKNSKNSKKNLIISYNLIAIN